MKAVLIFSTYLIALSGFAGVIKCTEESSAVFVEIYDGHEAGYVSADEMCINLQCTTDSYGLSCQGMAQSWGYGVYIYEQGAVVSKTNGLNYDTLSVLSCEESNEVTPEA